MDEMLGLPAPRPGRCQATNREGAPCGRAPHPGANVCLLHGAAAPQVRESARRRLLAAADFAIDHLLRLLEPRPPCQTCGRSDADRDPVVVRACQLVLDRAGFHPTLQVQVQPPESKFANLTIDELIVHLETMLADAIATRDRERAQHLPEAEGAVLIDDGIELPEDDSLDAPEPDPLVRSIPVGELTKEPASD